MRADRRRACAALAFGALAPALPASAQQGAPGLDAPNPVPIRPDLWTSGQPTPAALRGLGALGIQAVVYLAPWSVPDAVADEPAILQAQGIAFVHLPIPFGAPTAAHREALTQALASLAGRRVLVHCQINLRASTMVFLHRVIAERAAPAAAWESVTRVWTPTGAWAALVREELRRHAIAFEPL